MKYKLTLLVFTPFIIGFFIDKLVEVGFINNNQFFLSIFGLLLAIWTYGGAIAFWFYVGRTFGKLNMTAVKSFIFGNIPWGISFIIFIWQTKLLEDTSRNLLLSALSQHYVLGFIGFGTRIVRLFTNNIHGTTVILSAYFLMIIVFSLGFWSALRSKPINVVYN